MRNGGTCRSNAKGDAQGGSPRKRLSTEAEHRDGAAQSRGDRHEMLIRLHRKRFEPAWIDRASVCGVMVGMLALHMRDGASPQHLREFAILSRPEEEVPVIQHQAIGSDAEAGLGVRLSQNLLKGGVVSGLVKQRESPDATVQIVIGEISGREAWRSFYRNRRSRAVGSPLISTKRWATFNGITKAMESAMLRGRISLNKPLSSPNPGFICPK